MKGVVRSSNVRRTENLVKILQEFATKFNVRESDAKIVTAKFIVANCIVGQSLYNNLFEGTRAASSINEKIPSLNCADVRLHFSRLGVEFWNDILGCVKFRYTVDNISNRIDHLIFYNCNTPSVGNADRLVSEKGGELKYMPLLSKIIDRIGTKINVPDVILLLGELCNLETTFINAIRSNPLTSSVYARDSNIHWDFKSIYQEIESKRTKDLVSYTAEIHNLFTTASISPPIEKIERIPQFDVNDTQSRIATLSERIQTFSLYIDTATLKRIELKCFTPIQDGASIELRLIAQEHILAKQLYYLEHVKIPIEIKVKMIEDDIAHLFENMEHVIDTLDWRRVAQSDGAELFFQSIKMLLKIPHFIITSDNSTSLTIEKLHGFRSNLTAQIANLKKIDATFFPTSSLQMSTADAPLSISISRSTTNINHLGNIQHLIVNPNNSTDEEKLQIMEARAFMITLFTKPCDSCRARQSDLQTIECDRKSDRCQMLGEILFIGKNGTTDRHVRRRMAVSHCGEIISIGDPAPLLSPPPHHSESPEETRKELKEVTPERAKKVRILRFLDALVVIVLSQKVLMNGVEEMLKEFIQKLPADTAAALTDEQKVLLFFGIFIAPESQEVAFEVLKSLKLPIRPKASTTKKIIKMRASQQEVRKMYQIMIAILKEMERWRMQQLTAQ